MTKNLLDRISIKQPCSESWGRMTGNDEVRFCSHCAKNVYDLSTMSRARAERLIQDSGGNLCARYVINKIAPPPAQLAQITRRSTVAAGVLAGSLAMSSFVYAQAVSSDVSAGSDAPRVMRTMPWIGDSIVISGIVKDPLGAVVPGATVVLRSVDSGKIRSTVSDADGAFAFDNLKIGRYEIEITAIGFVKLIRTDLKITQSVTLEETLGFDDKAVLMGVVALYDLPIVPTVDSSNLMLEPRPRPLESVRHAPKTERKKKKKNNLPK